MVIITQKTNEIMKRLCLMSALLVIFTSCVNSNVEKELSTNAPKLYAEIVDGEKSRTYLEQAKYMRWHAEDEISAFLGNTLNQRYGFDGKTGANSGTFSAVSYQLGTGNKLDAITAVYPYTATTTIDDITNTISYILPRTQNHVEGDSYGQGANPMVATTSSPSDTFLYFRNVCGYLKLQLYGEDITVEAISVKGNNGEKLSGLSLISAAYNEDPSVVMAETATEGVVLKCGDGVLLSNNAAEPTIFWVVLPPTTFENGFTISIKSNTELGDIKTTDKQQIISRNEVLTMPAFAVVCDKELNASDFEDNTQSSTSEIEIPDNQIWYTTTDENKLLLDCVPSDFGAILISNKYENGQGVLTFDDKVTKISSVFKGNTYLRTIIIPNSVTSIGDFADCSNLTNITFGSGVVTIGSFSNCTSLINAVFPDNVTSVSSFSGCTSLANITFGRGIKKIESNTFNSCTSLTSVIISGSIYSIGDYAFYGCSSLTSVTIGNSVTSIGNKAFYKCNKLKTIFCKPATPPAIYYYYSSVESSITHSFPTNSGMKIYVPSDSYKKYTSYSSSNNMTQGQEKWFGYKSYIEPYDFE